MEFEKIKEIIAEVLNVDVNEITMDTTFVDDLGADSLDVYQIIMGIESEFDIEIDKAINEFEIFCLDLELIATTEDRKSIVRFYVNKLKTTDEDDTSSKAVVPFQVAYAVSIHKSQGLEYNSVRVIITTEVEELITHNIFYTAITRAKNKLKIYWTPEAQSKVIKNLKHTGNARDAGLIASKYNLKRVKR